MRLRLAALSAAVLVCSQTSAFVPRMLAAPSPGVNVSRADVVITAAGIVRESALDTTLQMASAGEANQDGHFRYDAALSGYIVSLSTKGLSPGVYTLSFTAGSDPTEHEVEFRVR